MNIQIYGTSKCFDTKKAERYFKERRIPFQRIDLLKFGLSPREFETVLRAVGKDALLNKNSKAYETSFIAHLAYEEDILEKLRETPALYTTPIVRNGKQVTVGYRPEIWATWE